MANCLQLLRGKYDLSGYSPDTIIALQETEADFFIDYFSHFCNNISICFYC